MKLNQWLSIVVLCVGGVVFAEELTDQIDLTLNYRLRTEMWDNGYGARLNADTGDESLTYSRLYLGMRYEADDWLAFGVEMRDSRVHNGPDSFYQDGDHVNGFNDDDPLDISQLYLTISCPGDFPFSATIGRQYWAIGDQRLVGALKWTNNARGFDGVKVDSAIGDLPISIYYGRHINQFDQNHVNDAWDSGYDYLTGITTPNTFLADDGVFYALYSDRKATGMRDTVTVGALSKWKTDGPYSFSNETALQGGDRHQAYAASARATYTTVDCPMHSAISLELNYGSGDSDLSDEDSRTFDNLYPTNHAHYGMMDYASWRNAMNAAILLQAKPLSQWKSQFNVWALGLAESQDNWYGASGSPVGNAAARDNGSQFLGTELDFINTLTLYDQVELELGLGYFFAGPATEGRTAGEDAAFGYLQFVLTY